jgi:hypothetical protein
MGLSSENNVNRRLALRCQIAVEFLSNFTRRSNTLPREVRSTADLSTTLRSGRDDKGKGGASEECGGRTEAVFHHLGWAEGSWLLPVEMTRRGSGYDWDVWISGGRTVEFREIGGQNSALGS